MIHPAFLCMGNAYVVLLVPSSSCSAVSFGFPVQVSLDHSPEVQRGENVSSPLQNHTDIPEERKSLSSEAELLLGCCCHLLPTWKFAAHDFPSLWPMSRERR